MSCEASVTAEPYVPMAAHTSAATSLLAAVAAERGVEPSSSMTSCTLFPLMPPALFSSSVMSSQIFCMSCPSLAKAPVIGAMRPILMGAAKANELHNIAVATAATIPIRFFILSSLEEM